MFAKAKPNYWLTFKLQFVSLSSYASPLDLAYDCLCTLTLNANFKMLEHISVVGYRVEERVQ